MLEHRAGNGALDVLEVLLALPRREHFLEEVIVVGGLRSGIRDRLPVPILKAVASRTFHNEYPLSVAVWSYYVTKSFFYKVGCAVKAFAVHCVQSRAARSRRSLPTTSRGFHFGRRQHGQNEQ